MRCIKCFASGPFAGSCRCLLNKNEKLFQTWVLVVVGVIVFVVAVVVVDEVVVGLELVELVGAAVVGMRTERFDALLGEARGAERLLLALAGRVGHADFHRGLMALLMAFGDLELEDVLAPARLEHEVEGVQKDDLPQQQVDVASELRLQQGES